jgi:hypothetical protein
LAYSFPAELRGNYYLLYARADKGSLDTFWKNDDLKRLRLPFGRRVQIARDIIKAVETSNATLRAAFIAISSLPTLF